jgi:hypothetical protein
MMIHRHLIRCKFCWRSWGGRGATNWQAGQPGCLGGRGRHLSLSCFWATLARAVWQVDNRLPCFTPDQAMASTLVLYHILWAPGCGTPAYAQETQESCSISTSTNRQKGGRDSWAQIKKWRHHHISLCILKNNNTINVYCIVLLLERNKNFICKI